MRIYTSDHADLSIFEILCQLIEDNKKPVINNSLFASQSSLESSNSSIRTGPPPWNAQNGAQKVLKEEVIIYSGWAHFFRNPGFAWVRRSGNFDYFWCS